MSIPNQITIDSTNSTVTVQTDENLLLITNVAHSTQITPPKSNQIIVEASPVNIDIQTPDKSIFTYNETPIVEVDVIQPVTKVIQVANVGPQGPVGPMGPMGPPGVITAASGLIVTGSIFVSGSPGSVIATSFTGSFSGSIRAPGSNTQLIFNNAGVLAGTSNITYTNNNNLLSINTSQTTIGGFTHITNAELASQGTPQLLVGDGSGDASYYAIIPKIYTSKGTAALGQKAFASRQTAVGDRQKQEFFIETGIVDGEPSTGTESPILTLTDQERVGIGTTDPQAKLQVVGSVLISGSSTLTNIGPAVFSGSISQQSIFTSSLGYLTSTGAVINGNVTITGTASINTLQINQTILSTGSNQLGDNSNDTQTLYGSVVIPTGSLTITGSSTITDSLYIIKKVSIGTTHQSASLTISASSNDNALLVKLSNGNGDTDKFKINNEGVLVLGALNFSMSPFQLLS